MNSQPERVHQGTADALEPAGPSLIVKIVMRPMTKMLNPLIVKLAGLAGARPAADIAKVPLIIVGLPAVRRGRGSSGNDHSLAPRRAMTARRQLRRRAGAQRAGRGVSQRPALCVRLACRRYARQGLEMMLRKLLMRLWAAPPPPNIR